MKRKIQVILLAGILLLASAAPAFGADSDTTQTQTKIKLSLQEAIKIMTTTGSRAETANLNKQSDLAVAKEYSEQYSTIKDTLDSIDTLQDLPQATQQYVLTQKGYSSISEMVYEAQVAGVSQSNKRIINLRKNFANKNAENNYQADLNQIREDTIDLYNSVLLAEENYKIALDNLSAQQKNLKNVNAQKAVGMLTKRDVFQAQSAVADAEQEVREAKTKQDYAHMAINYLLGYPVLQEVEFTDQLKETTAPAVTADQAVANAIANRNEIRGADFAKDIYQVLFEDVHSYPANSSTYLSAQIKALNAEKSARDARTQIEIDLRNRVADVMDKKAALEAAKSLQRYAQEGLRVVGLTNEEGLSTVNDLLTTQVSAYKANLNVAKATSDYNLAVEELEIAQGVGTMRIPL